MRDDLLGKDVERIAQEPRGLDVARDHATRDHRRFEQIATMFGIERAGARLAH